MDRSNFDEIASHVGHNVIVVGYGRDGESQYVNVAIECETCGRILLDWDRPTEPGPRSGPAAHQEEAAGRSSDPILHPAGSRRRSEGDEWTDAPGELIPGVSQDDQ
jgi:hypothetical protein